MAVVKRLQYIDDLISGDGQVTLGSIGPVGCCVAAASDGNQCLAMLVRDSNESLAALLARLDSAIEDAVEHDVFVDELNA